MARSLTLLLLPWLLCTGCLFIGEINERPRVRLVPERLTTVLGRALVLAASVEDDQAGAGLTLRVRDAAGDEVGDACAVAIAERPGAAAGGHTYDVTIWRPGEYSIEATATDRFGARGSTATVVLRASDAPPEVAAASGASAPALRTGAPASACNSLYPAGRPIPVRLDSMVLDPEATWAPPPSGCKQGPDPLSRTWRITAQPAGAGALLGRAVAGSICPEAPIDGAPTLLDDKDVVCLYVDAGLSSAVPAAVSLVLELSDGTTTLTSATLTVPVIGDAPACLDGVYPAAGAYVIARDQPSVFQALAVDDVTAAGGLLFTWSLARAGESAFTVLGGAVTSADGGGRYVLDPAALGLAVGDVARLRVEVAAPDQGAAACASDEDVCLVGSCVAAPATTCPRRATWSLEIR